DATPYKPHLPRCPSTTAQLRVVGPGHPLTATVGQDVVLPCYLSPQRDARSLEVRWIRDDLSETVHHYRNGEDLYGEQMGAYAGRTELVRDVLSAGSLDLRITGLRPSDDGLYVCTVGDADAYAETIAELEVSPGLCVPPRTRSHPHGHLRGLANSTVYKLHKCCIIPVMGCVQGLTWAEQLPSDHALLSLSFSEKQAAELGKCPVASTHGYAKAM
uniref:Ig-like domain-containing protein n=1 Tax=Anas platyrhynchos platyrhynchos TaxID=8840 RepID=U3I1P3_ANAPP